MTNRRTFIALVAAAIAAPAAFAAETEISVYLNPD